MLATSRAVDWPAVLRNTFLVLAALQGWLFWSAGGIAILIGLRLAPADPAPGESVGYGPWNANLKVLLLGLGLFGLGLPGALGVYAVLNEKLARRPLILRLAAAGTLLVGTLTIWFLATGRDLA